MTAMTTADTGGRPLPDTATLNHLYLCVADLDRSVGFYRRYFGFGASSEWQGEAFVIRNAAGFALAFAIDPEPPAWPSRLHVGFILESVDVARDLLGRIRADGIPIVEAYEEPGFVVFKVKDPDGCVVEVEAGVPVFPPA